MNCHGPYGLITDTHHGNTVATVGKVKTLPLFWNVRHDFICCELLQGLVYWFLTVKRIFIGSPAIAFGIPPPS